MIWDTSKYFSDIAGRSWEVSVPIQLSSGHNVGDIPEFVSAHANGVNMKSTRREFLQVGLSGLAVVSLSGAVPSFV